MPGAWTKGTFAIERTEDRSDEGSDAGADEDSVCDAPCHFHIPP